MNAIILTNCSASKKSQGSKKIKFKKKENLEKSFIFWEDQINKTFQSNKIALEKLSKIYTGTIWEKEIPELKNKFKLKDENFYVFSAGLGIRKFSDLALPYDITFSNNQPVSISNSLFEKVLWLKKIEESYIFDKLYNNKNLEKIFLSSSPVYVILSTQYMNVLIKYLELINFKLSDNIYLFCNKGVVKNHYFKNMIFVNQGMDYVFDKTSLSFKKRGFSSGINIRLLSDILNSKNLVKHDDINSFLKKKDISHKIPKLKRRQNISDDEIKNYIKKNLNLEYISINKLHNKLRNDQLWQCEDKRFANLYKEVKNSL